MPSRRLLFGVLSAAIGVAVALLRMTLGFPLAIFVCAGWLAHGFGRTWLLAYAATMGLYWVAEVQRFTLLSIRSGSSALSEYLDRAADFGLRRIDTPAWIRPENYRYFAALDRLLPGRQILEIHRQQALAAFVVTGQSQAVMGGAIAYSSGHGRSIVVLNEYDGEPSVQQLFQLHHELDHVSDEGAYQLANASLGPALALFSTVGVVAALATAGQLAATLLAIAVFACATLGLYLLSAARETRVRREWIADLKSCQRLRERGDLPQLLEDLAFVRRTALERITAEGGRSSEYVQTLQLRLNCVEALQQHPEALDASHKKGAIRHLAPFPPRYLLLVALPFGYLGTQLQIAGWFVPLLGAYGAAELALFARNIFRVSALNRTIDAVIGRIPRREPAGPT